MKKPKAGDIAEIVLKNKRDMVYSGTIMPRQDILGKDIIVIKLSNGYNIGIHKKKIFSIKITEEYEEPEKEEKIFKQDHTLPLISILHTGGTIASKVDYRTGAVFAKFSPEDMLEMFPELAQIANIKSRLIFQMFSEDMEPEHWAILAKEIHEEIKEKVKGVIITHGTDTMGYTAAALSFMLRNLPIPVILVGSQRSSDRGSSDAFLNLICAARFIANTDFTGVAVCMHGSSNDKFCYIHHGTHARKMHSSSRAAFESINSKPIARIFADGATEYFSASYEKKTENDLIVHPHFEKKIAIVKIRPGFDHNELRLFEAHHYKGIILEGTGLGHAPINDFDRHTKHHKHLLDAIRGLSKKMLVVMTTQCISGPVNLNVYSTGRDLLEAGIIEANMFPETAYVKLGWAIGNSKDSAHAKELFLKNIAGEISERLLPE